MMPTPFHSAARPGGDLFLQPGDWHVGQGELRLRTLLGTCVSIVLWHPVRHIGAMCHYMLPGRSPQRHGLDGRYAEDAWQLLQSELLARGTRLSEYRLALAGGGNMFPGTRAGAGAHVGTRNAEAAREFVRRLGLRCDSMHLEGEGHRDVTLDLHDGRMLVRQVPPSMHAQPGVLRCAA